MSDKFYVGLDLTGFENNGAQQPVSRVTFQIDDLHTVTAGDDSGLELLADCPYATQEMADSLLLQVKDYPYKMYSAANARIDPAAELGDGVTACGLYAVIARIADDGCGFPTLSAPGKAESEEEFPISGPVTQAFDRKIAETRSQISKTTDQIRLEVQRVNGQITELSASLSLELDKITSNVQDLQGNFSQVQQTISSINASVKDVQSGLSHTVRLAADGITITNANGSKLTIDGGQINAATLHLTGHISFSDLNANTQSTINNAASAASNAASVANSAASTANSAVSTANSAAATANSALSAANSANNTVKGWTYSGTTYIDGKMIASDTIVASKLKGGEISILDANGNTAGVLQVEYPNLSARNVGITSGNVFLTAENGYVTLASEGSSASAGLTLGGSNTASVRPFVLLSGDVCPNSGSFDLGRNAAAYRWDNIFLNHSPAVSSDLRVKTNVLYQLDQYDAFFDALQPIAYSLLADACQKRYLGFGAQDVQYALLASGLLIDDFAGLLPPAPDNGLFALQYEQFVPLCVDQIQKLKTRLAALERSLSL